MITRVVAHGNIFVRFHFFLSNTIPNKIVLASISVMNYLPISLYMIREVVVITMSFIITIYLLGFML